MSVSSHSVAAGRLPLAGKKRIKRTAAAQAQVAKVSKMAKVAKAGMGSRPKVKGRGI